MSSREIPCVFQIPLNYGKRMPEKGGCEIEPELMGLIIRAINRQFQGFTPLGTIRGGNWTDEDDGAVEVEDQERVEVWATRERIPVLKKLVHAIGKETGQKQMFLIVPEAYVHRINVADDGTDLASFS